MTQSPKARTIPPRNDAASKRVPVPALTEAVEIYRALVAKSFIITQKSIIY